MKLGELRKRLGELAASGMPEDAEVIFWDVGGDVAWPGKSIYSADTAVAYPQGRRPVAHRRFRFWGGDDSGEAERVVYLH